MVVADDASAPQRQYQAAHNMFVANALAVKACHEMIPGAKIGCMLSLSTAYPNTCRPEDVLLTQQEDQLRNCMSGDVQCKGVYPYYAKRYFERNHIHFDVEPGDEELLRRGTVDFYSFSYYMTNCVTAQKDAAQVSGNIMGGAKNPYLKATEWNWQIDPLGFRTIITRYANDWRMPVFPIENGIGVIESWDGVNPIEDTYRIDYHRAHIDAMKAAMFEDGAEVIGYLGWGLIDILSSQGDMRKRYGVVYVNRENHDLKDLRRVPKKSYAWLKQVIHTNGREM